LSAIPICLSHDRVISVVTISPQTPNSSRVRKAAIRMRLRKPSPARPTRNAELMTTPRAVCSRRVRPPVSMRSSMTGESARIRPS